MPALRSNLAPPPPVQAALAAILASSAAPCCDTAPTPAAPGPPPATTRAAPTTRPRSDAAASRPRAIERAAERDHMVTHQIAERGVRDPRVLRAMREVPRHWFVPSDWQDEAYADRPLPIGHGQTISQPYIVALMTEALDLKPGRKVLEIGTGSGYQAAVLSELTDRVYTIEIVEPLARRTIDLLRRRGYRSIRTRIGDGYQGWPEAAPFDAIIVTCAPEQPPPALIEQLAPGGRMCIPVGPHGEQELIVLRKHGDGTLHRESIAPVMFVPMTGEARRKQ